MARLSSSEKDAYARDGYIVPAWRFPQPRIDEMRAALDKLIADNPGVRPEKLVSAHLEKGSEGVKGSRAFLELARDPELVELISDAIGQDVILWGCQVFCKPGGDGLETPFHQDGHYWPIRPLATCTAWVALDPSRKENGCLKVVPGSHRDKRLFDHLREDRDDLVLTQRIRNLDESKAVDIELEPGQMSLHDVYMIHGATVNRSPMRRAGVAIRYMPGTSVFERDLIKPNSSSGYLVDFSTRPLWLLKGKDRTGRNDLSIGH
ncbi:MAG TPA: phytanoyl-CoA dioxygenase family protein [Burkholderiales bacterium]|nr:phytanoyl-CoA dioxygenase family protein [Burkholderiales bacterium]